MILMPIFMLLPKGGFYTRPLKETQLIIAKRETVLSILKDSSELTLQEVAIKTNQDIRTTQAILTVLKRHGKVESVYTERGKLWRAV